MSSHMHILAPQALMAAPLHERCRLPLTPLCWQERARGARGEKMLAQGKLA